MFSTYDDCKLVMNHLIQIKFLDSDLLFVRQAMNRAESFKTDREKIFYVIQAFQDYLWDLEEAVDDGFKEWMNNNLPLILDELKYIEKNGDEYEKRTQPRIYQKP